ncbi:MAG TPA: hypothetical protein VFF52_27235 [Isosphaeraceae bacterium]|nr:hypothetical protein [Isosphaeraceae bacterium]
MTAAFVALSVSWAIHATGQAPAPESLPYYYPYQKKHHRHHTNYILPPGPGDGWGFPNGSLSTAGWADYGVYLPLAGDRTTDYFFPRYYSVPPEQMFLPTYYNPFVTRGQRYLPYVADGGAHPAGGGPTGPADLPVSPYAAMPSARPTVAIPRLNGRSDARVVPIPSGGSGLTP